MKLLNFDFDERSVTTFLDKNKEIWFSAADVCKILEHSNASQMVKDNCEKEGISRAYTPTTGGKQSIIIINESNLYRLIFKSKRAEAKNFQKWVFDEVLPSLRKTGKYSIPEKLKKESTNKRNLLTSEWKKHGISNPNEYRNLTLDEYHSLGFEAYKRKKDLNKSEILLLSALESMEMLKLYHDDNINGYPDCKESIEDTADNVKQIINKKEIKK